MDLVVELRDAADQLERERAISVALLEACEEALKLMPHAHANACDMDPRCDTGEPFEMIGSQYKMCEEKLRAAVAAAKGE